MSQGVTTRRRRATRASPRGTQSRGGGRKWDVYSKGQRSLLARVARIGAKRPVLRAVLVFGVLMGLFYGCIHSPYVGDDYLQPYLGFVARVTGGILRVLGHDATVHGALITSPDFSVEIVSGCDAVEPVAAFAAAVLASPASLWLKIPVILAGSVTLLLINFVRIVSLFYIGIYFPKALDIMHFDVWQAAFIVLAFCLWAIWIRWATRAVSRRIPSAETAAVRE